MTSQITALMYELLDAHEDTARLAAELEADLSWQAHLQYLRALQRVGREVLAHEGGSMPEPAESLRHG